jgi:hypothetical protein
MGPNVLPEIFLGLVAIRPVPTVEEEVACIPLCIPPRASASVLGTVNAIASAIVVNFIIVSVVVSDETTAPSVLCFLNSFLRAMEALILVAGHAGSHAMGWDRNSGALQPVADVDKLGRRIGERGAKDSIRVPLQHRTKVQRLPLRQGRSQRSFRMGERFNSRPQPTLNSDGSGYLGISARGRQGLITTS